MKDWIKEIKKLSKVKKLFLVLLLIVILAWCAWFYLNVSLSEYHERDRQTVDMLMRDLAHEDYELAYRKFAERYKKEESFDTFKKAVIPNKDIYKDYEPNSFDITHMTRYFLPLDSQTLEYRGIISFKNGSKAEITAVFIWENDGWKLYLLE